MTNKINKKSSSCSQCGTEYPIDDLIEFENLLVCFKCKPVFLQRIREGGSLTNKKSRSKWWKVYFFVFLLLSLLNYIEIFQDMLTGKNIIYGIIDFIISPFVLVGVFGYAFNRKILNRKLWKIVLPVSIICDLIGIHRMIYESLGDKIPIAVLVIGFIILTPLLIFQYIALYKYAYSDIEPWK